MSKDFQDEKKYYKDNLFTKETFGVITGVFSLVVLFVLFSRGAVFGAAGTAIASFVLGVIGFAAYPVFIGLTLLSVRVVFGLKSPFSGKEKAMFSLAFLFLFMIIHTATVSGYTTESFGAHISACFNAVEATGHSTALGVIGGLLTYAVISFATAAGAYIMSAALLAVTVYAVIRHYYTKKSDGKKSAAERRQEKLAAKKLGKKVVIEQSRPYPVELDFDAIRGGDEAAASVPTEFKNDASPVGDIVAPAQSEQPAAPQTAYSAPVDGADYVTDSDGGYYSDGYYNPYAGGRRAIQPQPEQRAESGPDGGYSYDDIQNMTPDQRRRLLFTGNPIDYRTSNLIYSKDSHYNNRSGARRAQNASSAFEDIGKSRNAEPRVYGGGSYLYETPERSDKTYIESYQQEKDNGGAYTPTPRIFTAPLTRDEKPADEGERRRGLTADRTENERGAFTDTPRESLRDYTDEPLPRPTRLTDGDEATSFRREVRPSDDAVEANPFAREEERKPFKREGAPDAAEFSLDGEKRPSEENGDRRFGRMPSGTDDESRRAMRDSLLGGDRQGSSNGGYFSSSLDLGSSKSRRGRGLTPTDEPSPFDSSASDGASSDTAKGGRSVFDDDKEELRPSDRLNVEPDIEAKEDKKEPEDEYGDKSRFLDDDITSPDDLIQPAAQEPVRPQPKEKGGARGMGIFGQNNYPADDKRGAAVEPSRVSEYKREESKPITPPRNMNAPAVSNYPPKKLPTYHRPPLDLFRQYNETVDVDNSEVEHNKEAIIKILAAFNIQAEITAVTKGPAFTRYDVTVPINVTSKKVASCATEIAMHLQAKDGVNIYPNYANGTNSIEVPNKKRGLVGLGPLLADKAFVNAKPEELTFAIGRDVEGKNIYGRIAKMTHLLVAGATGSGKSVFLNTLLLSLITHYTPWQLRLILIDPKKIEFTIYNHLPHLMMDEIITEAPKVVATLNWAIDEMERRYMLFDQMTKAGKLVRNIDEYNLGVKENNEKLPKIVIIVDELADLMAVAKKDIEDRISRLAAKSRACGIHLVLATQRPSVDVITGVIKSNLPTRFAFKVAAEVDSRTILDEQGAEKLLGYGDMLYKTAQMYSPVRVQGALVESDEVQHVVEWIKQNNECYYDPAIMENINKKMSDGTEEEGGEDDPNAPIKIEPVFINALEYVIMQKSASISMLQRKFSIGYNKAGRIIEWMESMNYISAFDGARSRTVSITMDEFIRKYRSGDEQSGGDSYGG